MSPKYQPKQTQPSADAPIRLAIQFPKGTAPEKAKVLVARIEKFLNEGRALETLILEHW